MRAFLFGLFLCVASECSGQFMYAPHIDGRGQFSYQPTVQPVYPVYAYSPYGYGYYDDPLVREVRYLRWSIEDAALSRRWRGR
jgi:hypothetical protein